MRKVGVQISVKAPTCPLPLLPGTRNLECFLQSRLRGTRLQMATTPSVEPLIKPTLHFAASYIAFVDFRF